MDDIVKQRRIKLLEEQLEIWQSASRELDLIGKFYECNNQYFRIIDAKFINKPHYIFDGYAFWLENRGFIFTGSRDSKYVVDSK